MLGYLCTNTQIVCFLMCLPTFSLDWLMCMDMTPEMHLHNIYISFRTTARGQKTLSYCGARIWNYILDKIDSGCAIGKFKKYIQKCSWIHGWPIWMIQWYLKVFVHQWWLYCFMYICVSTCMYVYICISKDMYVFMHIHSSAILHWWYLFIHLFKIIYFSVLLKQSVFPCFSLLYTNCILLCNKVYFVVIFKQVPYNATAPNSYRLKISYFLYFRFIGPQLITEPIFYIHRNARYQTV